MSDHVSQELKEKVQKWLTEEGWMLQEAPAQDFFWAFVASNPSGLKINVAQPNGRSDQFIVRVGCDIHDAQSHLAKLPQKEPDEFIWDLRFELLRSEVEFDGLDMPLKRVSVSRTIYSDGLSKNSFADTLGKVLRGVMVVIWMLRRKFASRYRPPSGCSENSIWSFRRCLPGIEDRTRNPAVEHEVYRN